MLRGVLLALGLTAMAPQAQAVVVRFDIALRGDGVTSNISGSFRLNGGYTDSWDVGEHFSGGSEYHGLAFSHDLFGFGPGAIAGLTPITIGAATFGAEDLLHPLSVAEVPGVALWFDREPVAGSSPLMWMGFWKNVGGKTQYLVLGDTTPCGPGPDTICLTPQVSASDGTTAYGGSVRASVVPLPASLALMGAAFAGLGLARRRGSDVS